jgi:hypothetical protein
VRSLRKRLLMASFDAKNDDPLKRLGTYWGIRTDIAKYQLPDALPCPKEKTLTLAATPTRLKRLDGVRQERLINWGYAVCDTAMRRHVAATATRGAFPYGQRRWLKRDMFVFVVVGQQCNALKAPPGGCTARRADIHEAFLGSIALIC